MAVPVLAERDVWNVPDVAFGRLSSYTGGMPRQKNPDEITASQAIEILGTYRQYFYELVKQGRVKQHYRKSAGKRAFYLRSEIEALKRELDEEDQSAH